MQTLVTLTFILGLDSDVIVYHRTITFTCRPFLLFSAAIDEGIRLRLKRLLIFLILLQFGVAVLEHYKLIFCCLSRCASPSLRSSSFFFQKHTLLLYSLNMPIVSWHVSILRKWKQEQQSIEPYNHHHNTGDIMKCKREFDSPLVKIQHSVFSVFPVSLNIPPFK